MTAPNLPAAIKECDVRGDYPAEVDEALFARLGRRLGRWIATTRFPGLEPESVVLGGDVRRSTPALMASLCESLVAQGLVVVDLGSAVPTPVVYWMAKQRLAQAVAIVTASHSPPGQNGLKLMNGDRPPTPEDIRALADPTPVPDAAGPGRVERDEGACDAYVDAITEAHAGRGIDRLKVVLDPGNGCQVGVARRVFEALGARVEAIHDVVDGQFRDRHPDCAVAENLSDLAAAVTAAGADLGLAFDGDGDRLAVVDGRGRVLTPEQVAMILLQGALRPAAGQAVIMDIKSTMHLDAAVRAAGGQPVRCRSGHAHMKTEVLARGAVLGSEVSGHHFLGALAGIDDPVQVGLILAADLVARGRPLATLVDGLPQAIMTRDLRLRLAADEIGAILDRLGSAFDDATVETTDGVRLVWPDGWFLARRSVTEPAMTFRLEGVSRPALTAIGARIGAAVPALAPTLTAAIVAAAAPAAASPR